jgi:hypothetical protein
MPGALLPSRMSQLQPGGAADAPPPSYGEEIVAGFNTAKDDIGYVQDTRLIEAYRPVMSALEDINGKSHWQYKDWLRELNPFANGGLQYDYDSVWADVLEARRKNPGAFKELPASRDEFEKGVLTRQGQRAKDQETLARGKSVSAAILGGVGASIFDPVNVATLPFGGGSKTVGQAILREGIINGGIELIQQVPLAQSRERMGEELTAKEAAINVAAGTIFGGVLGGAGKYGADNFDAIKAAPKAVQEALWAKIAPMLPEQIRPKMNWDAIGDDMLPDIAEGLIGRENLSEAEADALAVVRREIAIEARNPFEPDGAGARAHSDNLADAMQRIFESAPTQPPARATVSRNPRETLRGSTAISSGVVPGDARSVMKNRIKVVESSGSNVARNPNSTALGPYQFLKGTWERLYRSRYGANGKSAAEIHALRTDPRLNEILMDDLMAINEASLRNAGIAPTAGNLYLAHFAGDAGARKLHRAAPNASAREVLGDAVVDANPFLARMTAADVINWAARKMGGKGGAVAPSGRSIDVDPEAALRSDLERQQAQIDADRKAIEDIAPRPRLVEDDMLPDPIHDGEDIPVLTTPIEAISRPEPIAPPAVPPRVPAVAEESVDDILPQLRAIVRDRAQSLNEPAKLAEALGIDEARLRKGLVQLAAQKEIRMNKKQQFMRLPEENGPVDILKFIGRAGGLSEDGLSESGRKLGTKGHALGKGGRDYNKQLIPGSGPLVRKAGRGIDEMGELLHEAGYFGDPQGPRPTEAEVLEAIDLAATQGRKIYPFGQTREAEPKAPAKSLFQSEEHEYYVRTAFDEVAEANGYSMDDADFAEAARILLTEDVDTMDEAVRLMVNRELQDIQAAAFYEVEEEYYASIEEQFAKAWTQDAGIDDAAIDGRQANAGNAGTGGADAPDAIGQGRVNGQDELEPPYLDQGALRAFDDPDGPAAMGVVDSLEHDLRASLIPERTDEYAFLYAMTPERLREIAETGPREAEVDEGVVTRELAAQMLREHQDYDAMKSDDLVRIITRNVIEQRNRGWLERVQAGKGDPDQQMAFYSVGNAMRVLRERQELDGIMPRMIDELVSRGWSANDAKEVLDFRIQDMNAQARPKLDNGNVGVDPAIAERQAQLANLKAASPMQAKVDQESTIGSPLFDAVDQPTFRLDDEGDPVAPADLLAQIDAEDAMIKTIKDCL